jgi:DNA-binding XRE family transcriptional regulator
MSRKVRLRPGPIPPAYVQLPCPSCGHQRPVPNGARLRHYREAAKIDQRTFGERVGVSGPYISDIERNRRDCPPDVLDAYLTLINYDGEVCSTVPN